MHRMSLGELPGFFREFFDPGWKRPDRRDALRRGALFSASAVAAASAASPFMADAVAAPDTSADIIFRNGPVYTVDGKTPWARAVAVKGKRIAFVGDEAGVQSLIGPQTRVVDLAGKMLLPGFVEGHIHPLVGAALTRGADLQFNIREDILGALKAYREGREGGYRSRLRLAVASPFRRPVPARRISTQSGPTFPSSCLPSTRIAPRLLADPGARRGDEGHQGSAAGIKATSSVIRRPANRPVSRRGFRPSFG